MEVMRHLSRDTQLIDQLDLTENKRKGQLRLASGLIGNASADPRRKIVLNDLQLNASCVKICFFQEYSNKMQKGFTSLWLMPSVKYPSKFGAKSFDVFELLCSPWLDLFDKNTGKTEILWNIYCSCYCSCSYLYCSWVNLTHSLGIHTNKNLFFPNQ